MKYLFSILFVVSACNTVCMDNRLEVVADGANSRTQSLESLSASTQGTVIFHESEDEVDLERGEVRDFLDRKTHCIKGLEQYCRQRLTARRSGDTAKTVLDVVTVISKELEKFSEDNSKEIGNNKLKVYLGVGVSVVSLTAAVLQILVTNGVI